MAMQNRALGQESSVPTILIPGDLDQLRPFHMNTSPLPLSPATQNVGLAQATTARLLTGSMCWGFDQLSAPAGAEAAAGVECDLPEASADTLAGRKDTKVAARLAMAMSLRQLCVTGPEEANRS
jgi:hypothetical protein